MSDQCLSNFCLDRHLLGELSIKEKQAVSDHLSGCQSCLSRYSAIASFSQEVKGRLPPFQGAALSPPLRRGQAIRSRTVAGLALATAAGFALFLAPKLTDRGEVGLPEMPAAPKVNQNVPTDADEVTTKGSIRLSYHVKRGDDVHLAGPNEVLAPNDKIQFSFSSEETGYLAILSVDGALATNVYFPTEGASVFWNPQQSEVPHSIILDDSLGREVFVAVFCEQSFSTEAASQELAQNRREPMKFELPGCRKDLLFSNKVHAGALGVEMPRVGKP